MTSRPSPSLGKRLLPALAMTTAASALVALLDRPSSGSAVPLATADTAAASTDGTTTAAADPTAVSPPLVSSTVPAVASQQATPTTTPATTTPATTPATTAATSTGACTGQTVDGSTINTRWGPVQVEAVVSATGQICDVDAIQSPDSHGRSVRINQNALPILHTEVMKAQSANINGVSGATVTSIGYAKSLQSILDSVGA